MNKTSVTIISLLLLILLMITSQLNAQKREMRWRSVLAYKKDSTVDTAKTLKNIIQREKDIWQNDTIPTDSLDIPDSYIGFLIEKDKANRTTRYKKGFVYYENRSGILVRYKLLEWIPIGTDVTGLISYRWRVLGYIPIINRSFFEYTDDDWIDVAIGLAYVDECDHKIKYYKQKQ